MTINSYSRARQYMFVITPTWWCFADCPRADHGQPHSQNAKQLHCQSAKTVIGTQKHPAAFLIAATAAQPV